MSKSRFKVIASLLISFLAFCAMAAKTVTVTAYGEGDSYQVALQRALEDAVRQVNGSVIRSDVSKVSRSEDTVVIVEGKELEHSTNVEGASGGSREVMKGVTKGYKVINKTDNNGVVSLKIEADVLKYESPVNKKLPRIAVFPFKAAMPSYSVGAEQRPAGRVAMEMKQRVEKVLSQSGQFSMLSRDSETEMLSEERFITQKAPPAESIKIGQRLGADFIIVGEVRDCIITPPTETISRLTGKKRLMISQATLRISGRMLVVSTSEIVWADDIEIDLNGEQLRKNGGRVDSVYENLLEMAAKKVLEAADIFMLSRN